MKKTTTKILGIGLAIAMAVMPLEGTVVHAAGENPVAAQETVIDTGKCGENATYQVSGNEVDGFIVYISGVGECMTI